MQRGEQQQQERERADDAVREHLRRAEHGDFAKVERVEAPADEAEGRVGDAGTQRGSAISRSPYCSRSRFFSILPVAPSGIASTKTTSSGIHHLAMRPS